MKIRASHELAADFLAGGKNAPSLRDVEKSAAFEKFDRRLTKIAGRNGLLKVLVAVLLLVFFIPFANNR